MISLQVSLVGNTANSQVALMIPLSKFKVKYRTLIRNRGHNSEL